MSQTLPAGKSTVVSLPAGSVLSGSGFGSILVALSSGSQHQQSIAGDPFSIGPFPASASAAITAVGGSILFATSATATPALAISASMNPRAWRVMSSPPSVSTASVTNPLVAGQLWTSETFSLVGNSAGTGSFSFFRGGYYRSSTVNGSYMTADTFTNGSGPYGNLTLGNSFYHVGSSFCVFWMGAGSSLLIKVDDEWTSLTPQNAPADGSPYYTMVDFGSVGTRRIDLIGYNLNLGGIYTGLGDSISPAPRRGKRMVVLDDSFGEGAINEVSPLLSWITYFAEYVGWDDVIASAIGSTGLIAGPAPKVNYQARIVRDAVNLYPDVIGVGLSVNDKTYAPAQQLAAAQNCVAIARQAGFAGQFVFFSPGISGGAFKVDANCRGANNAIKSWALAQGFVFVDDINVPFDATFPVPTTTITAAVSANATSIAIPAYTAVQGAHYKFVDGTTFYVHSLTNGGATANVDGISAAQAAGATITLCEGCYLTGTGDVGTPAGWGASDVCVGGDAGHHPNNRGHRLLGYTDATLFVRALNR